MLFRNLLIILSVVLFAEANSLFSQDVYIKNGEPLANYQNRSVYFTFTEENTFSDTANNQCIAPVKTILSEFWNIGKDIQYIELKEAKKIRKSAYSDINGHSFRSLADSHSGNKRTVVPFFSGQSFRF